MDLCGAQCLKQFTQNVFPNPPPLCCGGLSFRMSLESPPVLSRLGSDEMSQWSDTCLAYQLAVRLESVDERDEASCGRREQQLFVSSSGEGERDVIKDVLSLTCPSGRSVCHPDLLNASSVCFCQEANVVLPELLGRSSDDMMCQCGVEPQCHDGVRRCQCVGSMSNNGQIPVQLSSCRHALFQMISLRCVRIRLLQ